MKRAEVEASKYGLWDDLDNALDAAEGKRSDFTFLYQHTLRYVYEAYARFLRQPVLQEPRIRSAYGPGSHPEKYLIDDFPDGKFIREFIAATSEKDPSVMVKRLERLTHHVQAAMGGFEIDGWRLRTPA